MYRHGKGGGSLEFDGKKMQKGKKYKGGKKMERRLRCDDMTRSGQAGRPAVSLTLSLSLRRNCSEGSLGRMSVMMKRSTGEGWEWS